MIILHIVQSAVWENNYDFLVSFSSNARLLNTLLKEDCITGHRKRQLRYGVMEFHFLTGTVTLEQCYRQISCPSLHVWVGDMGSTADGMQDRFLAIFRKCDNKTIRESRHTYICIFFLISWVGERYQAPSSGT